MGTTEIVLLVLGIIVFVLSFVIPAKREKLDKETLKEAKEEIRKIVDEAVKEANSNIEDNVAELSDYNVEKAERAMERLCNEKIMAISEYSGTVLESIDKNHQEVMFLYDMLNEKHTLLKDTVAEVDKTAREVKQSVQDISVEIKEVKETNKKKEQKTSAEDNALKSSEKKAAPEEELQMIPLEELAPQFDEMERTSKENAIKQLEVIKSSKNKKTTSTRKKTTKVKEGEAPDLNIGALANKKDGGRNSNERILQMHNEGKSNVAIAKELGLGIGEVKLVIDLFEGI